MTFSRLGVILPMFFGIFFCFPLSKQFFGPDYMSSLSSYQTAYNVGDSGQIHFLIQNKGDQGAQAVRAKLYLSPYYYYDETTAIALNSYTSASTLAAGEELAGDLTFTIPNNAYLKSYLLLKIFPESGEADTYNNVSASDVILVAGGLAIRSAMQVDDTYHEFLISANEKVYSSFPCTAGHVYEIYWDDYYDGQSFLNTGADLMVSASSEDGLTSYFTSVDSGYTVPGSVAVNYTGNVFIDITAGSWGGGYLMRIRDLGLMPDFTVTINSHVYDNPGNVLTLTFTITNNSTQASDGTCFDVGLWGNLLQTPVAGDVADSYSTICRIFAAGESYSGVASFSYLSNGGNSYAYVDIKGTVKESGETNNSSAAYVW